MKKALGVLKNSIFQSHKFAQLILLGLIFNNLKFKAQIANYINNGGFEDLVDCNPPSSLSSKVMFWSSIDTVKGQFYSYHKCLSNVPVNIGGYQNSKSGDAYVSSTLLCDTSVCHTSSRAHFRNKLKSVLTNNTTYCVKFYVNIIDLSPFGIDAFGAAFTDASIDTINYHNIPLPFINPQIQNQTGNIVIDTMNWVPISGTFVAVGNENFAVIGNFKSDANTMTAQIQPTFTYVWCDINLDHVSCIPIDLPAYAGPDKWFIPGDSVYIGRESDVEIDESCIWYQLTSPTTSITIDTIAGIWVKPVVTSTYVVRQQLWCSGVKWDTVVVSLSGVGISEMEAIQNDIRLFPNPASDYIQLEYSLDISDLFTGLTIFNNLGQLIREEEIAFKHKKASVRSEELKNGVYFFELRNSSGETVKKRFIVSR